MPYSLSPDHDVILQELLADVKKHADLFLGYPVSKDFDYQELLEFLKFPMNNLGYEGGKRYIKFTSYLREEK